MALGSAVALAGCATGQASDDSTLEIAVTGEVPTFDPALQESGGDRVVKWSAVYDTLLRAEVDGTVVPGAAESYELNDDATELVMRLREGMTFANGAPVTADDAKASIEHMQQGGGSDAGRVIGMTIDAIDELTLVITAEKPTGQLPTFMTLAPGIVISREQVESPTRGSNPISSGPYEVDQARTTTGSRYTFIKRQDYWDADNHAYDTLVVNIMPDAMARQNALKSGQVRAAIIQQPQVDDAIDSGFHVLRNSAAWAGMYLCDRAGQQVPALGDVRVRRAINMAFDRKSVANGIFAGEAHGSTQIFNPDASAYLTELDSYYEYDLDGARALLRDAGWADGFRVEVPSQSGLEGSATYNPMVAQQLAKLNIEVAEVPLVGPTALSDILGGRFSMFFARIGTGSSLFDIVQSLEPDSIWNPMQSEDERLNPLLAEAQTLQEPEANSVHQEINRFIVEQAWFAPWVAANSFVCIDSEELVPEMTDQFYAFPKLWDFR